MPQLWQKWDTINAHTGALDSRARHGIWVGVDADGGATADAAMYARSAGVHAGSSDGDDAARASQNRNQTRPRAPKM